MACDRTGGHVYPAQVLADDIRDSKDYFKVIFYGVRDDDAQRLRQLGYDVYPSRLSKRRHIAYEALFRLWEAIRMLLKFKPACIVGFGGRASFFLVVLGSCFSKALLYEPNAVYGRCNSVLRFFASKIFLGLRDAKMAKEIKIGVPVRFVASPKAKEPSELKEELGLDTSKKTVFVFGGSSGSRAINASLRAMFEKGLFKADWQLIHLTGQSEFDLHKEFYEAYSEHSILCKSYTDRIQDYYGLADVIVARSGASTVAELEYLQKPIVFIPYPYAYNHQFHNARVIADSKGIQIIDQKFLDEKMLWTTIEDVFKNKNCLTKTKFAWTDSKSFAASLYQEIKRMVGEDV